MRHSRLLLVLLLAVFGIAIVMLLNLRFEKGDMFPELSSLRADPLGTRALYESLQQVGGLKVQRSFAPPEELRCCASTVVFAGLSASQFRFDAAFTAALIALASRGNRVVLTLEQKTAIGEWTSDSLLDSMALRKAARPNLLGLRYVNGRKNDAALASRLDGGGGLQWPGTLLFSADSSWRPIVTKGDFMLLGEKNVGSGSIVALHSGFHLSNQGLRQDLFSHGSNPLLSFIIGSSRTVIFDEWHHGIARANGTSELIARFGMTGVVFFAAAWFLLFVWTARGELAERRLPATALDEEAFAPEDSMQLLLSSYTPGACLVSICKEEWQAAFPQRQLPMTEGATAIETYNALYKQTTHQRPLLSERTTV